MPEATGRFTSMRTLTLILCLLTGITALLFVPGCEDKKQKIEADSIELIGPNCRWASLGNELTLQAIVKGKTNKTALGGKSETLASNVPVHYKIVKAPEGASVELSLQTSLTDAGGHTSSILQKLDKAGIYKIALSLPNEPKIKPLIVTVMGGISIEGNSQDGYTGDLLDKPLVIHAESAPGIPMAGVKLDFDLRKAPKGTRFVSTDTTTNAEGKAIIELKLGKKQGEGKIGVRILSGPWKTDEKIEQLQANFFVISPWTIAMGIMGGLAIFIFGMKLMSEGLSLVAGDRLRSLLHFLTRNRFAAVGMGALVTGFIQSSSACSVMVIGFVNASLMRLEQAIGVIMGANIGTTVTAQMLSFKLSSLALPAVALGVVITLLCKKNTTKFAAQILIGFGLLFYGMQMMAGPLKELHASATVRGFFDGLSCAPALGETGLPVGPFIKAVAAGALMTVVVQSSSAAIGLLLTLSGAGLIDVYTAFAVLLGDNIGTTITAVLASIGSSKTAKRTACAHVTFNITGTAVMIIMVFVPWNGHPFFMELVARVTDGDPFVGENLPRFLANAHTGFNVFCTIAFIWFVTPLAWLTRIIIPGEEDQLAEGRVSRLLEPHLLATPALALNQAWQEVGVMLDKGREALFGSISEIIKPNDAAFKESSDKIKNLEKDVDRLQDAVTEYISQISQESLTQEQSQSLPRLLHSVNDAERVGDHSVHLLRLAKRSRKHSVTFSDVALAELQEVRKTLEMLFDYCHELTEPNRNCTTAMLELTLQKARDTSKYLKKQIKDYNKSHFERHEANNCEMQSGVIFLESLQNLNRVGGHLLNIIESACLPTK